MNSIPITLPPNPSLTLQLLTVSIITLQRTREHDRIQTPYPLNQTYDYIVIGSGSAGSVVASRLSANPNISVLVIEAGGPQTVLTDIPAVERREDVEWGYWTTRQRNAGLAYGGHIPLPRGRVVGGSHNINYLVYNRGNRRNFDSWVNDYGARGWSYEEVLPYFLKSENNTDMNIVNANPGYHSTEGRMSVMTPRSAVPILLKWFDTMTSNGFPIGDLNGPTQFGINFFQQTIYPNATRSTTASAFLEPYRSRPNLQVITHAFATRLLFSTNTSNNANVRAIGVNFEYNGSNRTAFVSKELLLCAGSFNSPQLLMLSGIGPQQHLEEFNIKTLVNLSVGYNLRDHVRVSIDYEVFNQSLVNTGNQMTVENLYNYYTNYSGPLSQNNLIYQYMNSKFNDDTDWPDFQIDVNTGAVGANLTAFLANYEGNRNEWEQYYRPYLGENVLSIGVLLVRPRSSGRVYLNSTDPHIHPLFDTQYLSHPYDIRAITDGMRKAIILSNSRNFTKYARMLRQPIPGCQLCRDQPIWNCISYLECYARTLSNTVYHQVGTCKMGNTTDSVVDERLRVRGVERLRVIDGSVFPMITNGNTNAPTIMIAEYGVQMVMNDNS